MQFQSILECSFREVKSTSPAGSNTFVSFDVLLHQHRQFRISLFYDEVRINFLEKGIGDFVSANPSPSGSMVRLFDGLIHKMNSSAKFTCKCINNWFVAICKADRNDKSSFTPPSYGDVAVRVHQTGKVSNIHGAPLRMLANSEKTPSRENGRATPNQAGVKTPGVRREQVPTAKAKICSELHRNMQTLAEMTKANVICVLKKISRWVTDCNTKYIFFRPHRNRNFVPIGDERMSTNQDAIVRLMGWAGNMTASGLRFQGIMTE